MSINFEIKHHGKSSKRHNLQTQGKYKLMLNYKILKIK